MATAKKLTAEEKLAKALEGLAPLEAELSLLLPAQVWPFVLTLARMYILNNEGLEGRNLVASMALTLRQEAMRKFGYDTLETFALARLLKEGTGRWTPKPPRLDALSHINNSLHQPHRLTGDQDSAAYDILGVWESFAKFLEIAGRAIGGGGGARSSAQGPVDVMGQEQWEHHRDVFKPWQFAASRAVVHRRTSTGSHLTIAAIVYKVLVEDIYPEELDHQFALIKGTTLKALKAGLDAYHTPKLLERWSNLPAKASAGTKLGGLGGKTGAGGIGTPAKAVPVGPKRPPGLWQPPASKLVPGQKIKLAPRKAKKNA